MQYTLSYIPVGTVRTIRNLTDEILLTVCKRLCQKSILEVFLNEWNDLFISVCGRQRKISGSDAKQYFLPGLDLLSLPHLELPPGSAFLVEACRMSPTFA